MTTTSNGQDDQFTTLMQHYLDGTLAGDDLQDFEAQLRQNADLRRQFYETCRDTSLIVEIVREELEEQLEPVPFSEASPTQWSHSTPRMLTLGLAAIILLCLCLFGVQFIRPLGRLTLVKDVVWTRLSPAATLGTALRKGKTYALDRGIIRIEMDGGTIVTVAGPARFAAVNPMQLRLDYGRLGAQMGKATRPLTVRTSHINVVDIGTAFGIQAERNGPSTVTVFEGSVEVHSARQEPLLLEEGDAARATGSGQVALTAFDVQPFVDLWPLTKGIDQLSHLIEFIPPGPRRVVEEYRHNEKLFLLPECMNVSFSGTLRLDLTPETRDLSLMDRTPRPLQNKRVSSYSVFFNGQEPKTWEQPRRLEGQITFSKPILGVIYRDEHLLVSEEVLGLQDVQYPERQGRGLGPSTPKHPGDSVTLAPDGRTIRFDLHIGPIMDQFRVIVAAE